MMKNPHSNMNIIKKTKQYFDTKYYAIYKKLENLEKQIVDLDKKNEYFFFANQHFAGMNRDRVFLGLPQATGDLRRIQLAENKILKRIKIISDEIGISFFLLFGTALGAVRHKGFIPWDDDLDIGMLFSDFKKLEEYLKDDEELEIGYTYQVYGRAIVKVKYRKLNNIFIDIFLYSFIDATEFDIGDKLKIIEEKNKEYKEIILNYFNSNGLSRDYSKPIYIEELDKKARIKMSEIFNELDFYGVSNGDYIIRDISTYRENWCFKSSDLMPIKKNSLEFEGEMYDSLRNNEELLLIDFGDYMTFPPNIVGDHKTEFDEKLHYELDLIEKMEI